MWVNFHTSRKINCRACYYRLYSLMATVCYINVSHYSQIMLFWTCIIILWLTAKKLRHPIFLPQKEPRAGTCKLIDQKSSSMVGTSKVLSAFIIAVIVWRRKEKVQKQEEGIYELRINKISLFNCTVNCNLGNTPMLLRLKRAAADVAKQD